MWCVLCVLIPVVCVVCFDTCHLWCVRDVMGDELAPDHGYGHEVRVWEIFVPVNSERDLSWTWQQVVANTSRQADSIAVLSRQKP